MSKTKAALLILDGWGKGKVPGADAIRQAKTPYVDSLLKTYPSSTLITHGEEVGLPVGQMGNSEVGHLNIGAGRIVYQQLALINKDIKTGEFAAKDVLKETLRYAKEGNRRVHIMGLLSDGGVHSHIDHLIALCQACDQNGLEKIYIHGFTDGRDTDPKSSVTYLQEVQESISNTKAKVVTIVGRYYAMDRDKRWERVKVAYDALVNGIGNASDNLIQSIEAKHAENQTDEFLEPLILNSEDSTRIQNEDVVIFFNFRTDRPRQLTKVLFVEPEAGGLEPLDLYFVTMTRYDDTFSNVKVIYEKSNIVNTIGEIISKNNKHQLRIAETEKYPHVTFFFSGGREDKFSGEERILIPSPKVATYDLQPEMSANEITEAVISFIPDQPCDFICLNYANADMVGHTGDFEAAQRAVECVDQCLARLVPHLIENGFEIIIIADHGNSDFMINQDGTPNTAHTKNPVPCIYISKEHATDKLDDGILADVAPTLLMLMGIDIPKEMTGKCLIKRN